MREVFGEEGLLAEQIDGYEKREGQIKMANDLNDFLKDEVINTYLAEGEVGLGKSMAYLLTVLFGDHEIDPPLIVSSSSITLQNQLFEKDLKDVSEIYKKATGKKLRYTSFKGISNYVCLKEFEQLVNIPDEFEKDHSLIEELCENADYDGSKPDEINYGFWKLITCSSTECPGKKCGYYQACYYRQKRRNLSEYDIIVVNHSLLAAHYYIQDVAGVNILPDSDCWVIDEAHKLEEFVIGFFTKSLSKNVFSRLSTKMGNLLESPLEDIPDGDDVRIKNAIGRAYERYEELNFGILISRLERLAQKYDDKLINEEIDIQEWVNDLFEVQTTLESAVHYGLDGPEMPSDVTMVHRYIEDIVTRLDWLNNLNENIAAFGDRGRIKLSKINVSEILKDLWKEERKYILTSATLAVNKKFDFIADRLGIDKGFARGDIYQSSFDYKNQAKLVIPKNFSPKDDNFNEEVLEGIDKIIEKGFNKTLVMFTSYRQMNELLPKIKMKYCSDHLILSQSKNHSKGFLLRKFREAEKVILIAQAASFGTGVDIKGDKNIVLVKLNFDRPNDPLFKAQSDLIEAEGKSPFFKLSIPNVSIRTKQQVGRAVRSTTDRSIIGIMDGRLLKSNWGRVILNSLPAMKIYDKL